MEFAISITLLRMNSLKNSQSQVFLLKKHVNQMQTLILSVPAPLHADLAVKALKANKHVFVEKPLSMNLKEADKMIKEPKKSKRKLMVGHLIQYHPVF